MVTLKVIPLETIKVMGTAALREETEQVSRALRAQLGSRALQTGYWNNGMGQIGMLVTADGLDVLARSAQVIDLQPDQTRGLRDVAWMHDDERNAIEAGLNAAGSVELDVVLNSEIGYHIGANGGTVYAASPGAAAAHARSLDAITAAAGAWLRWLDDERARAGSSVKARARIDRAAWHALRMAPQVRALRLGDSQASSWPQRVLKAALADGEAQITLSLRGADGFSPFEGHMSTAAWATQSQAHAAAIDALLSDLGAGDAQRNVYPGVGVVSVRMKSNVVESLYARRDPRVRAVEMNEPIAWPALSNSMPLVNMGPAWAAGHRGGGQAIVILDTGVQKDHLFFRDTLGGSRVTYEACFGSNTATHRSVCPPTPSIVADSPVGLVNSGLPYAGCTGTASLCNHGTHVAGIAAGRSHPSLSPSGISGTMPDATIVAVQIYSEPLVVGGGSVPTFFSDDVGAALDAVYAVSPAGVPNPYTINASFSGIGQPSACPGISPWVTLAIANLLSRGVPFVAATGNNFSTNLITWPACVPYAIKVSGVNNDGVGLTRMVKANIGHPSNFNNDPVLFAPGGGVPEATVGVLSAHKVSPSAMILNSGTSMAAPHVSGFYAAVKAAAPLAGVADQTAWISSSAGSKETLPMTLSGYSGSYIFRRICYLC